MYKYFIFCYCIFANIAIAQKSIAQIKGQIVGHSNKMVRLFVGELPHTTGRHFDSVMTDKDGSFEFKPLTIKELTLASLKLGTSQEERERPIIIYAPLLSALFWVDGNNTIQIKAHKDSIWQNQILSDLQINKEVLQLRQQKSSLYNDFLNAYALYILNYEKGKDINDILGFRETMQAYRKMTEIDKKYAKKNTNSPLSTYILYEYLYQNRDVKQLENDFKDLGEDAKQNKYGQAIKAHIDKMKSLKEGEMAPLFSANDKEGKVLKLSDFKGKYVMLDFWGSWCKPCRIGHPHLRDIQAEYSKKNLVVIMVACRDTPEKWLNAIAEDKLEAMHHILNDGNTMNIRELYNITSYPTKILISPEGKIVGRYIGTGDTSKKLIDRDLSKMIK